MAKEKQNAAPAYFVRETRMFKGKTLNAGERFDPAVVDCSAVEAETWYRHGLLMTAEEMAAAVQVTTAPAEPGADGSQVPPSGERGGGVV